MTQRTVVVVGADDAARIAAKRAREVNPEARIVEIDPNHDCIALDTDARAVLVTSDDTTKRIRFDSLIFSEGQGIATPVVEKSTRMMPEFSFEVAKQALRALLDAGLDFTSFQSRASHSIPNLEFLTDAGAIVAQDGTLYVDEFMSTSLDGIYACGYAVSLAKAISQNRQLKPSKSMMERAAQVAGANAASKTHTDVMKVCAGSEIVSIADQVFARTGLSSLELHQLFKRDEFARSTLVSDKSMVRIAANRMTGAIISAELCGDADFVSQLNVLSMCVVKSLTTSDLIDLDLSSEVRETAERLRAELNNDTQSISGESLALWMAEQRAFQCVDVGASPSQISRYLSATHIPLRDLKKKLSDFSKERPLVLSSQSGRSAISAFRLFKKKLGYQHLFYLEGGSNALELLMGENQPVKH